MSKNDSKQEAESPTVNISGKKLASLETNPIENTEHFLNEVIPELEVKIESHKDLRDPNMPDFLYDSILQHQIQYTGPLVHMSTPVKEANVSLEEIYFQAEKLDPMLNSLSHKFKEEEKQDIKHYIKVTQQLESKKSFRLADKIETRRPSFILNTHNPMSKN